MSPKTETASKLNFESAMGRLEEIVEGMESGKMSLEDLIVRYEEGMKLVKVCQERLVSAEKRIEIIARDSAGNASVREWESSPEPSRPSVAEKEESKNDDVSLF